MTPSVMVTRQETSQRSVLPRLAGAVAWPPRFCPASALCSKLPEYKNSWSLWLQWQCLRHSIQLRNPMFKVFFWKSLRGTNLIFTNWEIGTDSSARCCKSMKPSFWWSFYRTVLRWSLVLWLWPMRGLNPRMQSNQFLQCSDVYAANLRFYSDALGLRERIGRAMHIQSQSKASFIDLILFHAASGMSFFVPSICTPSSASAAKSRCKCHGSTGSTHAILSIHIAGSTCHFHQRSQGAMWRSCAMMCHVYHCLWFIWHPFCALGDAAKSDDKHVFPFETII